MIKPFKIRYLFRGPRYPILVDIDGYLIAAKSGASLGKKLSRLNLLNNAVYDAIDSTGEGWGLYTEHMVLSPLVLKKRWTKLEIIRLYNQRKNKAMKGEKPYSEKSLTSKRFDRILGEIVELMLNA